MSSSESVAVEKSLPSEQLCLTDFLSEDRIEAMIDVSSAKKLLQKLSQIVSDGFESPTPESIFKVLTERERLGSTGIGNGVAVPHGRIDGLENPRLAVVTLQNGVEFDAPDGYPVWLGVCLLVPADAPDTHLKLLGRLANGFRQSGFLETARTISTSEKLHSHFMTI
ncbi:MAG: PTS sugar transporter subunit IIA [Pseudomonadota bacterium]